MALAREHMHLRFVIQDKGAVIQEGYKVHIIITSSACRGELTFCQYWSQAFPEALAEGRVKLQGASARSVPSLCSRAEISYFRTRLLSSSACRRRPGRRLLPAPHHTQLVDSSLPRHPSPTCRERYPKYPCGHRGSSSSECLPDTRRGRSVKYL
jgi:hypothetical protein